MKLNREQLLDLFYAKIGGTISDDEDRLLEEAMVENEEIARMWHDIRQDFQTARASEFLANIDEDDGWQKTKGKFTRKHSRSFRTVKRVAAIGVIATLGIFFMKMFREPALIPVQQAQSLAIQLQTADGKTIPIPGADSVLAEGGLKLVTKGGQLQYAPEGAALVTWNTLMVPNTLDYTLTLVDGTRVRLNAASTLRFPSAFTDGRREVYVTGEAFFEVAEDKDMPFIVHSGSTRITVLGTSFNVNAYDSAAIETSLVSGLVETTQEGVRARLRPGQSAYFVDGRFRLSEFDANRVLSWMNGVNFFSRADLKEIGDLLFRWYDVKLVIDAPGLSAKTFTGAIYKQQSLDVFLENLAETSSVRARLEGQILHLY